MPPRPVTSLGLDGAQRCHDCYPGMASAFAPLKDICTDRATPELMELTARLGSMMPYQQSAKVLAEFLPIEPTEKHTTVRKRTISIALLVMENPADSRPPMNHSNFRTGESQQLPYRIPIPFKRLPCCSRSRIARSTRPCHRRHFTALISLSMVGSASKVPAQDRAM